MPEGFTTYEFAFFAAGNGTTHSININGRIYSHTESNKDGESSKDQADALIAAISDPQVAASHGSADNMVRLTVRPSAAGVPIPVFASDNGGVSVVMRYTTPELAAAALVDSINVADWNGARLPQRADRLRQWLGNQPYRRPVRNRQRRERYGYARFRRPLLRTQIGFERANFKFFVFDYRNPLIHRDHRFRRPALRFQPQLCRFRSSCGAATVI